MKKVVGSTKNAFIWIYNAFALINSAIGTDKKYISKDAAIELIDRIEITCFLNLKILVHLSCEAKEEIKRMEVVSKPSLAKRVKRRNTVMVKTKSPNPSALNFFAIIQVSKKPTANPPNLKIKEIPPPLKSSTKSLSCNAF